MKTRIQVVRWILDFTERKAPRFVLTEARNIGKTYQNIGRREAARRLRQRAKRCTASS
jgi:hypothetical protein